MVEWDDSSSYEPIVRVSVSTSHASEGLWEFRHVEGWNFVMTNYNHT